MSGESAGERVDASAEANGGTGAPYMSYRGLINLLNKLKASGLPSVFDKSYFGNQSGSLTAQIRSTLKSLGLISDDYAPTAQLMALVEADETDRKALLAHIARSKYGDALALGENATAGQLISVFRARGLSGATVDKAISFYLAMLDDVGIPVSPHFKGRVSASNATPRKTKPPRAPAERSSEMNLPGEAAIEIAQAKTSTKEKQRADYVDMLMKLAESADGDAQENLLNRIERALQLQDESPS